MSLACNDAAPSQDEQSQPVQQNIPDRRHWTRLPVDDEREEADLIFDNGEQLSALIENFSFDGAKLTVSCDNAFSEGDNLEIVYGGAPMKATVIWIKETDDASWSVGVEWRKRDK